MKAKLSKNLEVNIESLIATRLLIQANSGGGKSYVIRKLIEESFGKVQIIALDIEGELSSLREKYDFVLAGKGGDISASPEYAEALAHKILKLRANLIVDLYELRQPDRLEFVRLFLDAMINAPKELWHNCMVILDEAHIFAPEKPSKIQFPVMRSVIDMATRGRKRGFGIVMATQRLSKLNKDAAAECNNKLIGRTTLDIDLKRAFDELGSKDYDLRGLRPGHFYAYGPSLTGNVEPVTIDPVETTHPQAGRLYKRYKPVASAKIKDALQELSEIPTEVEEEGRSKEAMLERIRQLERELKNKPSSEKDLKAIKAKVETDFNALLSALKFEVDGLFKGLRSKMKSYEPSVTVRANVVSVQRSSVPKNTEKSDTDLGICERKILGFLVMDLNVPRSKVQIGAMTGYAHSSGGFNNALSRLHKLGYIEKRGKELMITEEGLYYTTANPLNVDFKLEDWVSKLGRCERVIYETLLGTGDTLNKYDLAELTGYAPGSGGFNNAISRLSTLGLIQRDNSGIKINPEIVL